MFSGYKVSEISDKHVFFSETLDFLRYFIIMDTRISHVYG